MPSTTFDNSSSSTLALTQSLPGVGGGSSSTSLINGTVILTNNFTGSASLDIVFANPTNPITFFTNGKYYSYKIRDIHLITNSAPGSSDPFLVADISSAVPLPKTASMGLAMFGALGVVAGGAALRRRSIAMA